MLCQILNRGLGTNFTPYDVQDLDDMEIERWLMILDAQREISQGERE